MKKVLKVTLRIMRKLLPWALFARAAYLWIGLVANKIRYDSKTKCLTEWQEETGDQWAEKELDACGTLIYRAKTGWKWVFNRL